MTYILSKSDLALVSAFDQGWTVNDEGACMRPDGTRQALYINGGYARFDVRYAERHRTVRVHRLAALQRFGAEVLFTTGVCVRHLDNDKLNNALGNLVLGTQRDNYRDNAYDTNRRARDASREICRALNNDTVRRIVQRVASGETKISVARSFGVPREAVSRICSGRVYSEVTSIVYAPRRSSTRGRKLSDSQAQQLIVDYHTSARSCGELAAHYGISTAAANLVIRGMTYALTTAQVRARFEKQ